MPLFLVESILPNVFKDGGLLGEAIANLARLCVSARASLAEVNICNKLDLALFIVEFPDQITTELLFSKTEFPVSSIRQIEAWQISCQNLKTKNMGIQYIVTWHSEELTVDKFLSIMSKGHVESIENVKDNRVLTSKPYRDIGD
ncbi:MAG: hypothetical protein K0S39_4854 [Paenibacillus sp.]|jgi:hypothetical protein|nr:hypothetical protein [Paenibacillus sp.]